jgi:uncharacterized protein YbcI
MEPSKEMKKNIVSKIASEIIKSWQLLHGSMDAKAHIVFGENSLTILLENAFPPAERKLALEGRGALNLEKYYAAVVALACNSIKEEIGKIIQKKVTYSGQSMDLKTGWVMCIFQIETTA